ncbi:MULTISPECIES: nucleotidyltransferase family protein [Geoalkalibacter]|uniref:Nucleotidyltransferase family protein n=1 Tax=Geoalkalibacter halelectricus TaxID=2847045 RepID=A0ABY5ZQZ4_9BACT|nr:MULTISPECIES: nucleotidyltransferase family protein [Geoalkalibacter]MDO3380119.1 nucleotidyltransferase family protein [Geoalkalibacter halelectricus]UWZ80362.1 nucleotidyltransferase family protein [Geoalkalibacter halelectricus]
MKSEDIFQTINRHQGELSDLGVHRIGLFGSAVRGELKSDSDLDFLVEFRRGKKNYDRFFELAELLERLFGRKVDLLTVESLHPSLRQRIFQEARFETIH